MNIKEKESTPNSKKSKNIILEFNNKLQTIETIQCTCIIF